VRKPAGGWVSPGSMNSWISRHPPAVAFIRIASLPPAWYLLVRDTLAISAGCVNAQRVTDVSFSGHDGNN
jgi:hypothetical protein